MKNKLEIDVIAIAFITILISLLVLISFAWVFRGQELSRDPSDWGVFGDYLGGTLSTVVAFAALCALLLSLHLQRRELTATRATLSLQAKSQTQQRFETTLFNMLGLLDSTVQSVYYQRRSENNVVGRAAFGDIFRSELSQIIPTGKAASFDLETFRGQYSDRFDDRFGLYVGHYYRGLYWIYKLIDEESSIDEESAIIYLNEQPGRVI